MGRRVKFALFVIVSQLLLIAMAIAWVIHMAIIAVNGAVYFIENNPVILWFEITAVSLIALFSTGVLAVQLYRMGERRGSDERRGTDERRRSEERRLSNARRLGTERLGDDYILPVSEEADRTIIGNSP
jgi:membrane protein implicated in regulation of membrane protease activity